MRPYTAAAIAALTASKMGRGKPNIPRAMMTKEQGETEGGTWRGTPTTRMAVLGSKTGTGAGVTSMAPSSGSAGTVVTPTASAVCGSTLGTRVPERADERFAIVVLDLVLQ